MTKDEALELLRALVTEESEFAHKRADRILLEYINEPEIEEAFDDIDKWYA